MTDLINGDDGYSAPPPSDRAGRGAPAKWNDAQGWVDRDGIALSPHQIAYSTDTCLVMWKDRKPTYHIEKPLPDPEKLNAAIPVGDWETG